MVAKHGIEQVGEHKTKESAKVEGLTVSEDVKDEREADSEDARLQATITEYWRRSSHPLQWKRG